MTALQKHAQHSRWSFTAGLLLSFGATTWQEQAAMLQSVHPVQDRTRPHITAQGSCIQTPGSQRRRGAHSKALAVFGLVADVDQEGHHAGLAGHERLQACRAQQHALTYQALLPGCAAGHQGLQAALHYRCLRLVALHMEAMLAAGCCSAGIPGSVCQLLGCSSRLQ